MRRLPWLALAFILLGTGWLLSKQLQTDSGYRRAADPSDLNYRQKVVLFVEEAKAGSKMLALKPSVLETETKKARITDLYTRIPEPPIKFSEPLFYANLIDGVAQKDKVPICLADKYREINDYFNQAIDHAKSAEIATKSGDSKKAIRIYSDDLPYLAKKIGWAIELIEAKLNE